LSYATQANPGASTDATTPNANPGNINPLTQQQQNATDDLAAKRGQLKIDQ
jgi:hypothetical protein